MLGTLFGQFIGGLIWGIGATVASSIANQRGTEGLHDVAKLAVKTYLTAAGQFEEAANSARQNFDSIIAEVETEIATERSARAA